MNSRKRLPRLSLLLIAGLSMLLVLLSSGCLWGIVRDAETGAPIAGAEVTYIDVNGNSGTATTNANGIYAFDQASVAVPARGPVSFNIAALGYQPLTAARLVQYDDSNGNLSNLSTFWEVQHFDMVSAGMKISNAQLEEINFFTVPGPPAGGSARFWFTLRLYGTADPLNPSCEQTSAPLMLVSDAPFSINPPDFNCITPGKDFLASVTVSVERTWPDAAVALDTSTTTTGWITSSNDWQEVELDSTDTAGPDSPNLEFHAIVRYRTSTIVPLRCEE